MKLTPVINYVKLFFFAVAGMAGGTSFKSLGDAIFHTFKLPHLGPML
jgi:hypothetical protein